MSELTDKLNYILDWLKLTDAELSESYNPGLTRQEINALTKDFPFQLSEEFIELYQWRNGFIWNDYNLITIPFLFPEQLYQGSPIVFSVLQESVIIHNQMLSFSSDALDLEYSWNRKWFPIGYHEGKRILHIIGDLDPSPVYLWDIVFVEPIRVYKNLTCMISVIAECCERGLYKTNDEDSDDGTPRIDGNKLDIEKEIYQKYNS